MLFNCFHGWNSNTLEICGSDGICEHSGLPACEAVSLAEWLLMFWRNLAVASLRVIFVDCLIVEAKAAICSVEHCSPVAWWHSITSQKTWGLLKLILVRLQFSGMHCHSILGRYRHFRWTQCLHYQGARLIACACRGKDITDCTGREERQCGALQWKWEQSVEIVGWVMGGKLLKTYQQKVNL